MRTTRFWLQLALLFCVGAYASPGAGPLVAGMALVASTNLHGTGFEKTVILLTQHNRQGTLGIAINRPAHQKLSEFSSDFNATAGSRPLYLGGPVHPRALFVLARTPPRAGWFPLTADIHFTGGATAQHFLKQEQSALSDSQLRIFVGYAGWAAGQLENEIQRGDWLTVAADMRMIFSVEPEKIWEQLYRLHSGKWI